MDKEIIKGKILDLASVHPIRRSLMKDILESYNLTWDDIDDMVQKGELKEVFHDGEIFYINETIR